MAAAFLVLAMALPFAPAAPAAPSRPAVGARAGLLMDAGTGAVLWSREPHRPALVASTTKVLTALVAEAGYRPGQRLRVPEAAERVDGSRFGFQTGMVLTREQLLTTLLAVSANDAAETLAAAYPGGRRGFVAAMQAKATELGCTDSTWRDPSGLDTPGHRASPADLAVLGRALLARPALARIVASPTVAFRWPGGRRVVLTNHNKLVSQGKDPDAIGIKTGYTSKAGHTLVAAERRGGRTLVAVVLDADDIYADTRAMFAYGFATEVPAGTERLGQRPQSAQPIRAEPTVRPGAGPGLTVGAVPGGRPVPLPVAVGGGLGGVLVAGALVVKLARRRRYRPLH